MSEQVALWRLAPTELAPHEDALSRFTAELGRVGGTSVRIGPGALEKLIQNLGGIQSVVLGQELGNLVGRRHILGRFCRRVELDAVAGR